MKFNSKLFEGIRISSNKKKKVDEATEQLCQWEKCDKPGLCKAPAGRLHEGEYKYFCLEHVREYNKKFNYFSGLQQSEISKFQREAQLGDRPTWSKGKMHILNPGTSQDFSRLPSGSAAYQNKLRRMMGISTKVGQSIPATRMLKPLERKAFETLGIPINATSKEIKLRYKDLVKQYHPDMNGGDRTTEDLLTRVLAAYKILQKSGFVN